MRPNGKKYIEGRVIVEKTAVILAGGRGTRLHPYTIAIPKPLVPIVDRPILEIIIIQLAKQGFERIIITVNHQANIIMAYFGNGQKWGIKIEYSLEDMPLGTMGPLKLLPDLPENFLVMNGDILSDLSYADFMKRHIEAQDIFSVASYKRVLKSDYGVLEVDGNRLVGFKEKPEIPFLVSMGVYGVSKKILNYIPDRQYFGFDRLMSQLLKEYTEVRIVEHTGYWMDIGRPDDYEQAIKDIENGIIKY